MNLLMSLGNVKEGLTKFARMEDGAVKTINAVKFKFKFMSSEWLSLVPGKQLIACSHILWAGSLCCPNLNELSISLIVCSHR